MTKSCSEKSPICLCCNRALKPETSVPRWNPETMGHTHNKEWHDRLVAKRAGEIERGELGYLGESHFCSASCALYFARTAAAMLTDQDNRNLRQLTILEKIKMYVGGFRIVEKRRNAK